MRLAHPGHDRGEHHEHDERDAHHPQRVARVVHHHLVDHHLGEQRRGERDELDRERGGEHLAPDLLVLQQFGDEPPEAERLRRGRHVLVRRLRARAGEQHDPRFQARFELGHRQRQRRVGAGFEVEQFGVARPHQQRGFGLRRLRHCNAGSGGRRNYLLDGRRLQEHQTGQRQRREVLRADGFFADLEIERLGGAEERRAVVGRRELLLQQRGGKRNAVQLAKAAQDPHEILC